MNYLTVKDLAKYYADKTLFEGLTFSLNKGDKIALIANNGSGKSSLLKIIAGEDVADGGSVEIRKDITLGFLQQEPVFNEVLTINELLQSDNSEILQIIRAYEVALNAQTEQYLPERQKAFEEVSAKMDEANAWDYERRYRQILNRFGIADLDQKIEQLSGGQRKRLALAHVLLDNPDLLILDEPTNHLDVEMIEWLENYLMQSNVSLLMVTHDRYFLDRVCNHIIELEDGKLYHHRGNYSYFLEQRLHREDVQGTETDRARKLMKKELEWMRRSPKARTTKAKSRINSFYEIKEKATGKKARQDLNLQVKMTRIGGKILEMKKVYKSYGDIKILNGFDYTFNKGERIGIVGNNGVGKTTFLNIITGKEQPDSGKVKTGDTIVYGYYSQEGIKLKEDKRVIDTLKDVAEVIVLANGTKLFASQFLQHFMFTPPMQQTYVSKLSGGERRKLNLLMVLMKNPNFLIMDEPTNDLDLLTLTKLEEFLMDYQGCLILVSHDRYFMDKLADHLFVFKGNGVVEDQICTYSEYRARIELQEKAKKKDVVAVKKAEVAEQNKKVKTKLTYKERLEHEKLGEEIEALEKEKVKLEEMLNTSGQDYEQLTVATTRLSDIIHMIDSKTDRWLELDEFSS